MRRALCGAVGAPMLLAATLVVGRVEAQRPAPTSAPPVLVAPGVFLAIAGDDTVAVERVTTAGDSAVADLRIPRLGARLRQTFVPGERGLLARYVLDAFAPNAPLAASPVQRIAFRFDGDTLRVQGAAPPVLPIARGTLPWLNPSLALVEQIVRRARTLGGDSALVPMLNVTGAQRFTAVVTRVGADSVAVTFPDVQMRLAVAADGRVTGGIVPAQRVRIQRLATIDARAGGAGSPDYTAPAGAPYTATAVTVPTQAGFTLAGTFTRPRGPARVPVVVLITGSGLEDRDEAIPAVRGYRPFRDIADTLGRRGIAVLRLDDRGYAGSGGDATTATSVDFANDVRDALAWLRARADVDPRRLVLLGHSEGGLIAPMIAAQDTSLAALVLMAAPAWTGRRVIADQNAKALDRSGALPTPRRDSLLGAAMRTVDSSAVAIPWLQYFLDYDPLVAARRVRAPVLVLQGETDRQVDPAQATELATALRTQARDVTVRLFPATNHLFVADASGDPTAYPRLTDTHVRRDVLGAIAEWLVTTLRVR